MKTPSNAGKELLPCPFCGGLPLVNYERIVCEDCRIGSEPEQPGCSILSLTERWNRRTTPPTQSQEGETPETDDAEFDSADENLMVVTSEFARLLERRLTSAQRENDRLRSALSQIAELNGDGDAQQFKLTRFQAAQIARKALSDAARAATEEGKRG